MFNQLFTSPRSLKRYSSGPLLEERLRYLAHWAAQGSTRSSLRLIAQHQLAFVDYLPLQISRLGDCRADPCGRRFVGGPSTPTPQPQRD